MESPERSVINRKEVEVTKKGKGKERAPMGLENSLGAVHETSIPEGNHGTDYGPKVTRSEPTTILNRSASDVGFQQPSSRGSRRAIAPLPTLMSATPSIPAKLDTSVVGQGTISGFADRVPRYGDSLAGSTLR